LRTSRGGTPRAGSPAGTRDDLLPSDLGPPTAGDLALGRAAAETAAKVGAKTERERAYIDAIGLFYRDSDKVDHRTRALAYRTALEEMTRRDPNDHEASIFFALMLIGTAPPADSTLANQKRAAEILNGMLEQEPQHPGVRTT
jgi:hypothetical protein